MARSTDDGRVWGRAEALDTLGRQPGRRRRSLGMVLGVGAIAGGAYLGFTGPASGDPVPTGSTAATTPTSAEEATCASVGVTLPQRKIPAEGIPEGAVVRLSRVDEAGEATRLVGQSYVLKSAPLEDEPGVQLSVLVRTNPNGEDPVEQVSAASADGSLAAAVLYDADWAQVVNECRGR
ncbi:MAG TPA: hypothetical protein VD813_15290 [Pseudonocardia sp.]|nr:hypothetical protein [Pseudonocardia sp.]